ncbi:MAG: MBL fold metallo-hydrolase [Candidatus Aenigmarchaeota archaeon]|nr:MBL fold metallo-hydrolase [Candidatus Aenigmarchaeota archaeon]
MVFEYKDVKLEWLGHDCFRIEYKGLKLLIDPFRIKEQEADLVLITHDHFDHCSNDDLKKIKGDFEIIAPHACKSLLGKFKTTFVKPGDVIEKKGIRIKTVPAYNINKFREPGKVFHPKEAGYVGFIITLGELSIYHAGDTDFIPEMKDVKADIALLPVSGTYVMTVEEAIEAANYIKPKVAIPMHYGSIVGSIKDAQKFKENIKNSVLVDLSQ